MGLAGRIIRYTTPKELTIKSKYLNHGLVELSAEEKSIKQFKNVIIDRLTIELDTRGLTVSFGISQIIVIILKAVQLIGNLKN